MTLSVEVSSEQLAALKAKAAAQTKKYIQARHEALKTEPESTN